MASAETLNLLLLQQIKTKHKPWDDALIMFALALSTVATIAACVWYLFFGPGFMVANV